MAHDHHFLERLDRVNRELTEFALSLYRDHEAVAYILDHVKIPATAPRVALSIDHTQNGPFVIVTRDGRFVTCLGAGMHHDHPTITRGQLDGLLEKVRDKRARREIAQRELRPDEDKDQIFQRILTRGQRLTREDFVALSAFEPLLGLGPFLGGLDLAVDATTTRMAMLPGSEKVVVNGSNRTKLERLDRLEWAVAHLMMLAGSADRHALDNFLKNTSQVRSSPTVGCAAQVGTTFFLRGAWVAARFGKMVLQTYKSAVADSQDWIAMLDAILGLGAIGLRHASALGDVRRVLEAYNLPEAYNHPDAISAFRTLLARAVLDTIEHSDERAATLRGIGAKFCVRYGEELAVGHPLRFEKEGDVPENLATTAALAFDGDVHDNNMKDYVLSALPLAARAAAEDFYFPREAVRAWFGQWSPEETLERIQRFARAGPKREAVRAPKVPGRNDPCSCGSGKKYKRCHG